MARKKLTKRTIDALPKATNPRGERVYDTDLTGFGIVSYPSGARSFFLEYGDRKHRRRYSIGAYGVLTPEEARARATRISGSILDGADPVDERATARTVPTFSSWADDYLVDVKARKKCPRDDERYLAKAKALFGDRPLPAVSVDDVKRLVEAYRAGGAPIGANRALASVRACLQAAWRESRIESNPAMRVKPGREGNPRTRTLTEDEYDALLEAVYGLENVHVRAAFLLLMGTGARLSEVLGAKWADFDLDDSKNALWRLPKTKSGKPQTIPLRLELAEMLTDLPHVGPLLVPGARDHEKPRPDLKKPWAYLQEVAGLAGVGIHDLRRTFGLRLSKLAGLHVASKLLRHSDIRVTEQHYAPLVIKDQRDALKKAAKVIPLRRKAGGK